MPALRQRPRRGLADAVAAPFVNADREIDHPGERIERAGRHDLLEALPCPAKPGRVGREDIFPEIC